jgi:antitoxin component of MazEF toxin-antitoxin module
VRKVKGEIPCPTEPVSKEEFLETLKDMEELLQGMSPEHEKDEVDTAETDETEA